MCHFLSETGKPHQASLVPHHSPAERIKNKYLPPYSKCMVLPEAISGLSTDIYSLAPGCGSEFMVLLFKIGLIVPQSPQSLLFFFSQFP